MLNEKDKRTFLLVVFGVAFVSFVTAAIACLTNAITFFADYQMISAYRVNPIRTPLNDNPISLMQ